MNFSEDEEPFRHVKSVAKDRFLTLIAVHRNGGGPDAIELAGEINRLLKQANLTLDELIASYSMHHGLGPPTLGGDLGDLDEVELIELKSVYSLA